MCFSLGICSHCLKERSVLLLEHGFKLMVGLSRLKGLSVVELELSAVLKSGAVFITEEVDKNATAGLRFCGKIAAETGYLSLIF